MSGMSASRSAVFTEQSPGVEVHVDGAWRPGVILGWRHDSGGTCEVWVRVTVADSERESWTGLADLRLPEPHPGQAASPRVEPRVATAPPTVSWSRAAARERLVAGVASSPRLSDTGEGPTGSESPRRRRRHGGDVTAEQPVVRADVTGRHRAPAVTGRHRATDDRAADDRAADDRAADDRATDDRATDDRAAGEEPRPSAEAVAAPTQTMVAPVQRPELDCLTRPLRLGDRVPRPRLPRPGDSVRA
ncbi:hypothetical protein ACI78V_07585 [Geodermatophilus sp. SYSU D00742]